MASLNNCSFIGRIGKKAEIRTMNNGKKVASFSLAIDQSYKKDGQKVPKTEWVNIVIFSEGLVIVVENYTNKGSLLYISGALQTRKWTDNNNNDKYVTEIVLQGYGCSLQMLDGKKQETQTAPKSDGREFVDEELPDDDIPF